MINHNATWLTRDELEALPFAELGEDVFIDSSVSFVGVENMRIGNRVRIDAQTIIIASGPVRIGSRVHIAAFCYFEGRGGIIIEDFANISSYVGIHSVSDDPSGGSMTNPMIPERFKNLDQGEIVVGRHSIIYTKATLLPGACVGEGAVIGAYSLVKGDIPPWTIFAGVPARYRKERSRDLLVQEYQLLSDEGL